MTIMHVIAERREQDHRTAPSGTEGMSDVDRLLSELLDSDDDIEVRPGCYSFSLQITMASGGPILLR